MRLRVQSGFHPDQANLCRRLRYSLGGDRPSQTAHQILSPPPENSLDKAVRTPQLLKFIQFLVRVYTNQEKFETGDKISHGTRVVSHWCPKAPTYAEHVKQMINIKLQ